MGEALLTPLTSLLSLEFDTTTSKAPISAIALPLPSPSWGRVLPCRSFFKVVMLLKAPEPASIAGLSDLSVKLPWEGSTNCGS